MDDIIAALPWLSPIAGLLLILYAVDDVLEDEPRKAVVTYLWDPPRYQNITDSYFGPIRTWRFVRRCVAPLLAGSSLLTFFIFQSSHVADELEGAKMFAVLGACGALVGFGPFVLSVAKTRWVFHITRGLTSRLGDIVTICIDSMLSALICIASGPFAGTIYMPMVWFILGASGNPAADGYGHLDSGIQGLIIALGMLGDLENNWVVLYNPIPVAAWPGVLVPPVGLASLLPLIPSLWMFLYGAVRFTAPITLAPQRVVAKYLRVREWPLRTLAITIGVYYTAGLVLIKLAFGR